MFSEKRFVLISIVLVFALPISVTPTSYTQQTPRAHFGTGIVMLARSKYNYMFPVLLSPSGHWFAAITYPPFSTAMERAASAKAAELHLWDLRETNPHGILTQPEPIHNLSLAEYGNDILVGLAFSPDERRLAVYTTTKVVLFSLPALQEGLSLPLSSKFPASWRLSWSTDGDLLAILLDDEIIVWNVHTNTVIQHDLGEWYDALHYLNGEWLIQTYNSGTPYAFVICAIGLDPCTPYVYPGIISVMSPAVNLFLSHRIDVQDRRVYGIWTRREDGAYLLDEVTLQSWNDTVNFLTFSPQGTYLYASWIGEGDAILQWDTLQIVSRPPESFNVVWTPDEAFVALRQVRERNRVTLYDVGQNAVADLLDLEELDIKDLWYYIDSESISPRQFSTDGRWLLFNLGRGALLIPIVYG